MFVEHNNRNIAKKYAEYITGDSLRRYVARKVKGYVGVGVSVFDGAIGSGQLEQYIDSSFIYGVEVQKEACDALMRNYKNATVENISFFNYSKGCIFDCVVMNPPFSLRLKDLSSEEISNIQREFDWKKSGVVDDVFILKSMKMSKRYSFYICFPGISYRRTELKMRELIGNRVAELNVIKGAFEDTLIDVMFLVVDNQKKTKDVYREIFDCKTNAVMFSDTTLIDFDSWELPRIIEEKDKIDIFEVEREIKQMQLKRRRAEDRLDKFIRDVFYNDNDADQMDLF